MSDEIKEYYPGSEYQRLFRAIANTDGTALETDMDNIIKIVHEDFPVKEELSEKDFKHKVAEILKEKIYFSGQLGSYVILGALEDIWNLHRVYKAKVQPGIPSNIEELATKAIPDHPYPDMNYPGDAVTKISRESWTEGYKEAMVVQTEAATEREVMIHVFAQVRNLFERRSWIMEGRGSYPYNDDRYKEEVRYLYEEFDALDKDLWKNIKSKTFEYRNSIIAEAKNEISDMRIKATLGFAKWCFENSVMLASDGKWYYEADMLQHAAMDEEETWTDGTKELPAYSDEQIFKSYIESLIMEVRHDQS